MQNKYQPGTFCIATLAIPQRVSTAAYSEKGSQSSTSTNSNTQHTTRPPRSRISYIEQRFPAERDSYIYQLHFTTSFSNQLISTQFYDHPEKQDEFLPIGDTPKHNDHEPLRIGWDRNPAYLSLVPGEQLVAADIMYQPRRAEHKVTLAIDERLRLTMLIAKRRIVIEPHTTGGGDDTNDGDDTNSDDGDDKGHKPTLDENEKDTSIEPASKKPLSYAAATNKGKSNGLDDAKTRRVRRWLGYVNDMEEKDNASLAGFVDDDEDDNESTISLSPDQRAAYQYAMDHPLIDRLPRVIFSSLDDADPSTLARDEVDPSAEFLKEVAMLKSMDVNHHHRLF
ncbi:hypothetical protein SeMB42_g03726 [Synchytrium endobioticum]|nr:hypothetical protein SeMB42_g03726 [Synchytrium endobioticum]